MSIDDLLDSLDDMVDKAPVLPLSGGRCILDAEKVRGIIDEIRLNMPKEIRQAKAIVADRMEIIKNAKAEAAGVVKSAADKVQAMVSEDEIVRQAKAQANDIVTDANQKSKEMKIAATDFADRLLTSAESGMTTSLGELRKARQALKTPQKLS